MCLFHSLHCDLPWLLTMRDHSSSQLLAIPSPSSSFRRTCPSWCISSVAGRASIYIQLAVGEIPVMFPLEDDSSNRWLLPSRRMPSLPLLSQIRRRGWSPLWAQLSCTPYTDLWVCWTLHSHRCMYCSHRWLLHPQMILHSLRMSLMPFLLSRMLVWLYISRILCRHM